MPLSKAINENVGFIRLNELTRIPTAADIENLLAVALKTFNRVILPWSHGSPPQYFALGVSISRDPFDSLPRWAFYKGWQAEAPVDWAYATPDSALIHNMLLCSFADEVLTPEAHNSYAYVPAIPPSNSALHPQLVSRRSATSPLGQLSPNQIQHPPVMHGSPMPVVQGSALPSMQGSLQKMHIETLMQSLNTSRLTGRVQIKFHDLLGEIFFESGTIVHCHLNGQTGRAPLLELLAWRIGDFEVFDDERAPEKTVQASLTSLILESATIFDYEQFLSEESVDIHSVLYQEAKDESFYRQALSKDTVPVDQDLQKSFYDLVDDRRCLGEITNRLKLSKVEWLPIAFNLVKCGLIKARPKDAGLDTEATLVDPFILHAVRQNLINPSSGFYSYGALLFFVEQEMLRFRDHRTPFAVLLTILKKEKHDNVSFADVINRISSIRNVLRPSDLLCHFENIGFGIVLPHTDAMYAKQAVRKILLEVTAERYKSLGGACLGMKIGSAAVPTDCTSVGLLLSIPLTKEHSSVVILR
jgi:hypothetical protein